MPSKKNPARKLKADASYIIVSPDDTPFHPDAAKIDQELLNDVTDRPDLVQLVRSTPDGDLMFEQELKFGQIKKVYSITDLEAIQRVLDADHSHVQAVINETGYWRPVRLFIHAVSLVWEPVEKQSVTG